MRAVRADLDEICVKVELVEQDVGTGAIEWGDDHCGDKVTDGTLIDDRVAVRGPERRPNSAHIADAPDTTVFLA